MTAPEPLRTRLKKRVPLAVRQLVRRNLRRRGSLNLEWTLGSGIDLVIHDRSDWTIYNDIFVEGEYDVPITRLLDEAPEDGTLQVLDLGANVGLFTLRLVDQVRRRRLDRLQLRMTLVEGDPATCAVLRAALARNGLLDDRVRVVHGLVGQREGVGRITPHATSGMSTVHGGTDLFTKSVPFVDLEALMGGADLDLVKCDIEGSEQLFLENYPGLLARTRRAVFEFHPQMCDVPKCVDLVRAAGLSHSTTLRAEPTFEVAYFWRDADDRPA